MKDAACDGDRFDLVILADAVRALLAEAFAHAMNVREDQRLCAASRAHEGVEDNRFKEGEAQRVGGENDALPRMRPDEIDRRQAHEASALGVCMLALA